MKQSLGVAGRITALFQNNRLTPLLAIALFLAGMFALLATPREEEPQIDVTMATLQIAWPGASVQETEQLIAIPAERILSRMEGTEHISAMAAPGMALLTVQFKVGVRRDQALVTLHDTLRTQADWLPADLGVLPPVVRTKGVDDVPIVTLALHSNNAGPHELEQIANSIKTELMRVPGTRDIWLVGAAPHTIRVDLDAARMAAAGISVHDVSAALLAANHGGNAGRMIIDGQGLVVDTGVFLQDEQDVANVYVNVPGRPAIRLHELANIGSGPPAPAEYVSFRSAAHQSTEAAVTLAITKKPGENAIAVADALMQRVQELKNTLVPDDVSITQTRNYGATASAKARALIYKLVFASLSVVLLVMLALGRREAGMVGVAVGLTLAATLFASWAWGFTLNRVSLFALIFSIGILVDDAIVVVENIHRHARLHPDRPALVRIPVAVDEVGGPTILATFTVIAALLPMAFVTGLMGPYMSPIPINASMGMLISLIIALTLTPWLALHMGFGGKGGKVADTPGRLDKLFRRLFVPFLAAPGAGRRRRMLGAATLALLAGSALLPVAGLVELKMLPFDDKSEFQVLVKMPANATLEQTDAVLQELGDALLDEPEVLNIQTYAGTASPINFNGLVRQYDMRRDPSLGDIQVNLVDKGERSSQSHAIAMRIRPAMQSIAARHQALIQVVEVPPGPPVLAPVVAEIYGPEAAGRESLARSVRNIFEQTAGMVDIGDTLSENAARLVLQIDRERAHRAGVSQAAIVQTLQTALTGTNAGYLHDDQATPTAIRLQLPGHQHGSLETLLMLPVRSRHGDSIPVGELLQAVETRRETNVQRKDLLPVQYVTADMAGNIDSPLYGMFAARKHIKEMSGPDGSPVNEYFTRQPDTAYQSYGIKWDGEWQITYETFRDMGLAYALGLLLIYLLVVAHFGSYLMPLIIMAPIPLTIIGVMPGHALLGKQFTATSMIGMIALAGIIVRNSILLVDFMLMRLREGSDLAQAVIESAIVRTQPILLTGLAASLGAFFILDDPIFNGLAIALISGIAVSTALTLIIIPLMVYGTWHKHPQNLVKEGEPT